MNAYDTMNKEVYQLRESLGADDPMTCKETGEKWNNDAHKNVVATLFIIRRLAKKHHRLAEMDCNGEGVIRGQRYYGGAIDEYAKQQYGTSVKTAYPNGDENSIFTLESDKVEAKISDLIKQLGTPWRVEFQGDPRGYTVKVLYGERYINLLD